MKRRSDYWRDHRRAREANESFYRVYKAIKEQQSAAQAGEDNNGNYTVTASNGAHSGAQDATQGNTAKGDTL